MRLTSPPDIRPPWRASLPVVGEMTVEFPFPCGGARDERTFRAAVLAGQTALFVVVGQSALDSEALANVARAWGSTSVGGLGRLETGHAAVGLGGAAAVLPIGVLADGLRSDGDGSRPDDGRLIGFRHAGQWAGNQGICRAEQSIRRATAAIAIAGLGWAPSKRSGVGGWWCVVSRAAAFPKEVMAEMPGS